MLKRSSSVCIAALLPLAFVAACGSGDDARPAARTAAEPVEIANPGVLTGSVAFAGTPPAPEPIDMRSEPACADKHNQQPMRHTVQVNDNGTLRNVFVYVRDGLDMSFPTPAEAKELDQDGCVYEPHVMGIQTGQTLVIRNSDPVLHNVNTRPSVNRGFNISQPQEGMTTQRSFSSAEVMIPVRCDVHGWMNAYIGVLDHPYYAVTGEDGSFRVENLPPGDYVIEAWHEEYGTQIMSVTIPPDGTAEASFTYGEGMARTPVPLGEPIDPHDHHAERVAHAGGR
jgi:plastocyanin